MTTILCKSVLNTQRYNIQWKIENYSHFHTRRGEELKSPVFETGNDDNKMRWSILFFPEGTHNSSSGSTSLYLKCESNVKTKVFYSVSVINKLKEKVHIKKSPQNATPLAPRNSRQGLYGYADYGYDLEDIDDYPDTQLGFVDYLSKKALTELLDNDSLTIDIEMEVVEGVSEYTSVNPDVAIDPNPISTDFLQLLETSACSDFTITVKDKTFKVHRLVLYARSPVFRAMFSYDLLENKMNVMDIKDVEPVVMEAVIKYMYSGKCDKLEEMTEEILCVSDKYCLEHLKSMCEAVLIKQLDATNIILKLSLAETFNLPVLKKNVFNFINHNRNFVFNSSEWKKLSSENKNLALEVMSTVIDNDISSNKKMLE